MGTKTGLAKILAAAVLGLGAFCAGDDLPVEEAAMTKGSIVAVGGGEDRVRDRTVLKTILAEAKGPDPRVCVVTTATSDPAGTGQAYTEAFTALGVADCAVIHISQRAQAFDPAFTQKLDGANVVFFSGGDQLRLTALLGGTPFLTAVRERHADGAVISGTSAGGAALSDLMVYGGQSAHADEKGHVLTTSGFRFVDHVAFDTHFLQRDRLHRLFNIVASNPENLGIGLDEDTGVIFRDDGVFEVVGSGKVTVVDGTHVVSDIQEVERGDTVSYDGFVTHELSAGDRFNVRTREVLRAAQPPAQNAPIPAEAEAEIPPVLVRETAPPPPGPV